jgi:hypothetical protein
MKFALVAFETPDSRRHIQEHREEHRKSLEAWVGEQAQAGRLVGGEAFETEQIAPVTVRHTSGNGVEVTEGPAAGGEETLGGYFIIQVADRDEAVEVAKSWPTGETIEIRPVWEA